MAMMTTQEVIEHVLSCVTLAQKSIDNLLECTGSINKVIHSILGKERELEARIALLEERITKLEGG